MPGKKIFVIDDEPAIVMMLESRLKSNGYEVTTAANGQEGLAKLQKERPDLILLDVMMPVMDGFQFFKTVKKDLDKSTIPIIMLTARSAMRDTFEAMDADEFIAKPFEADDLLNKVSSVLRTKILLFSEDAKFVDDTRRALELKKYGVDIVGDEESMFKKAAQVRYQVIIVHLPFLKREPADLLGRLRQFKGKGSKIFIYCDSRVKGTETNNSESINEVRLLWERAKADVFFDSRISKAQFLPTLDSAIFSK